MSNWQNQRPQTSEITKTKISEAGKGKHKFWEGKTFSKEHRAKIGEASKKSQARGQAVCHPKEQHYSKELCMKCYNASYWRQHPHGNRKRTQKVPA
jgi:hypothetical protein